ncbi:MAG TPA: DUF4956 domain-containing protein, partial [Desulfobacterales bacterium]|nr:DUF4956 domain-containing protein [Desulfobacterales bacterium]
MSMFQDFSYLSIGQVVGNILVALLCGLFISLLYRWTYRGPSYSTTFVQSIVPLSMITTVVIMVIGNNLARAFGLVGALSIIRFRTAIKDTQDIVFIFFALAVGMAAGVGLHLTAITGTIFIGAVIFILSRTNYASPRKQEFVLQFSFTSVEEGEAPYLPVLEKHCRRHKLINLRSFGDGDGRDSLGLSFYVSLKDRDKSERFIRELG